MEQTPDSFQADQTKVAEAGPESEVPRHRNRQDISVGARYSHRDAPNVVAHRSASMEAACGAE